MRGVQNAITILEVLAVLAILFVFAAIATRDTEILKDVAPDDPDVELPAGPLQPEDIGAIRFGMVLRGYRMREVDDVLTRVAADLVARDQRILALEQALVDVVEPHVEAAEQGLITPAPEPAAVEAGGAGLRRPRAAGRRTRAAGGRTRTTGCRRAGAAGHRASRARAVRTPARSGGSRF